MEEKTGSKMVNSFFIASLIFSTVFGAFSGFLAWKQGKNPYVWFVVGFVFGIFGIAAIFFLPIVRKKAPLEPVARVPLQVILGPKDKFWYYLDANHQQQGPMSYEGLKTALKEAKLGLSSYVWNEELPEWKPLQELISTSSP
jgi:hypothetical protein